MKKILILATALALLAILAIPMAAFAADDTGIVNGTGVVSSSISIDLTAPSAGPNFNNFTMGDNYANSSSDGVVNFSAGIDSTATFTLTAFSGNDGYGDYSAGEMWCSTLTGDPNLGYLTYPMYVSWTNSGYVPLPGGCSWTSPAGSGNYGGITLYCYQYIALADAQAGAGTYQIVVELSVAITY